MEFCFRPRIGSWGIQCRNTNQHLLSHVPIPCAGQQIRLRGKNTTENEHVKLGAYHTLEIELQRPFSLYKQAWDLLDLERIKQACDPAASADLAAVLITVRHRAATISL